MPLPPPAAGGVYVVPLLPGQSVVPNMTDCEVDCEGADEVFDVVVEMVELVEIVLAEADGLFQVISFHQRGGSKDSRPTLCWPCLKHDSWKRLFHRWLHQ